MWEIVAALAAVVIIPVTVWTVLPKVKITADAQLDITNYLSVRVQARRSPVTVTAVRPVVYFAPDQPGQVQYRLNMSSIKPTGPIDLDARQVKLVGILLKMDEQELPRPDGGPLVRAPNRDEIRVRIDFGGTKGKNRILFLRPSLLDIALERH